MDFRAQQFTTPHPPLVGAARMPGRLSQGEPERSTHSSRFQPQAHVSVIVNVRSQIGNAPTFAHANRTCRCPASTICVHWRKVISRRKRSAIVVRMSATLAEVSVRQNARQPVGSSAGNIRITPPAGRQVARAGAAARDLARPGRPPAWANAPNLRHFHTKPVGDTPRPRRPAASCP